MKTMRSPPLYLLYFAIILLWPIPTNASDEFFFKVFEKQMGDEGIQLGIDELSKVPFDDGRFEAITKLSLRVLLANPKRFGLNTSRLEGDSSFAFLERTEKPTVIVFLIELLKTHGKRLDSEFVNLLKVMVIFSVYAYPEELNASWESVQIGLDNAHPRNQLLVLLGMSTSLAPEYQGLLYETSGFSKTIPYNRIAAELGSRSCPDIELIKTAVNSKEDKIASLLLSEYMHPGRENCELFRLDNSVNETNSLVAWISSRADAYQMMFKARLAMSYSEALELIVVENVNTYDVDELVEWLSKNCVEILENSKFFEFIDIYCENVDIARSLADSMARQSSFPNSQDKVLAFFSLDFSELETVNRSEGMVRFLSYLLEVVPLGLPSKEGTTVPAWDSIAKFLQQKVLDESLGLDSRFDAFKALHVFERRLPEEKRGIMESLEAAFAQALRKRIDGLTIDSLDAVFYEDWIQVNLR